MSGYRITLTFNLVQTGPGVREIFADPEREISHLKATLTKWSENADHPPFLVYLLKNKYTSASLSLDRLKGPDLKRVGKVTRLMEETGLICYLATVEKWVSGYVHEDFEEDYFHEEHFDDDVDYERIFGGYGGTHTIYDESESKLELKRVVDLDGKQILTDLPVKEQDFVQRNPFAREPDKEDYESEDAYTTHWYRNTASQFELSVLFYPTS